MEVTNYQRAEWAEVAVEAFAKETRVDQEERAVRIGDLLTNLFHYCDLYGLDMAALLENAERLYEQEVEEDGGKATLG